MYQSFSRLFGGGGGGGASEFLARVYIRTMATGDGFLVYGTLAAAASNLLSLVLFVVTMKR